MGGYRWGRLIGSSGVGGFETAVASSGRSDLLSSSLTHSVEPAAERAGMYLVLRSVVLVLVLCCVVVCCAARMVWLEKVCCVVGARV